MRKLAIIGASALQEPLIRKAKSMGVETHVFAWAAGDVGEKSALEYIVPLEERLAALSAGGFDYRIASGGGRMVTTMDRYNANWAVVENGWKAHVLGEGRQFASASAAVAAYYAEDPATPESVAAAR